MIVSSSNLATNLLIERVSPEKVTALMGALGAENTRVLRGVEDSKAFERGLNNTTTARDLMLILLRIAERKAVSRGASDQMRSILLEQKFKAAIPAGLPSGVKVAHKTGSITMINHDAAIIFASNRKPYILVVMTRGIADESKAHSFIATISRTIFDSITAVR
jgi:beta-lactamase class A